MDLYLYFVFKMFLMFFFRFNMSLKLHQFIVNVHLWTLTQIDPK